MGSPDEALRPIGWNGIVLKIPSSWQAIVGGPRTLVFEEDFQPIFQLRWESKKDTRKWKIDEKIMEIWGSNAESLRAKNLPSAYAGLARRKDIILVGLRLDGKKNQLLGGLKYSEDAGSIAIFQLLNEQGIAEVLLPILKTIGFLDNRQKKLWQIQDFSLATPPFFSLKDYCFAAGRTAISYTAKNLDLEICIFAQGEKRLSQQPLYEMVKTLADDPHLAISQESAASCSGIRTPSIMRQILYRLQRKPPFLSCRAWYSNQTDRILALMLCAKSPLPPGLFEELCENYETTLYKEEEAGRQGSVDQD